MTIATALRLAAAAPARTLPAERLRALIVLGCAAALILAGEPLPF